MSTLHTVNKSPFETNALNSCLEHASKGDSILLIEDGIYGALKGTSVADLVADKLGDLTIIALLPDLAARGIKESRLIDNIKTTDYAGFVELAANNERSQAWL